MGKFRYETFKLAPKSSPATKKLSITFFRTFRPSSSKQTVSAAFKSFLLLSITLKSSYYASVVKQQNDWEKRKKRTEGKK